MNRRKFMKAVGICAAAIPGMSFGHESEKSVPLKDWFLSHKAELFQVRDFIHSETKKYVDARQNTPGHVGPKLPYPYVPVSLDTGWNYLVYWDSYFITRLLLKEGHLDAAKNMVRDFFFLIDKYGHVPNANYYLWMNISQPPLLSSMVRLVYEHQKDDAFLRDAYPRLKKEYEFWLSPLHFVKSKKFSQYREDGFGTAKYFGYPENGFTQWQTEPESGWDFTTRFENRILDFIEVDLNSFLYKYEQDLEWMALKLALEQSEAELWAGRASDRKSRFNKIFWDDERKYYFDFDLKNNRPAKVWTLAGFLPIWAGVAGPEQIKGAFQALPKFEQPYGLSVVDQDYGIDNKQWNFPIAWPPLTWWVEECLRTNGYTPESDLAIMQYLDAQTRLFQKHGYLYEKYNAATGELVPKKRRMDASHRMLGWAAGVFVDFYDLAST